MADQGKSLGVAMSKPELEATTISGTADIGVVNCSAAMTVGQTASVKLISVSNAANFGSTTKIGQGTSDTVSFYGVTPVAQQSGATQAAISTSTLTVVSGTAAISVSLNDGYAFNQTQANNIITLAGETKTRLSATITLVNQLRSDLQDLGLIAGS